MHNYDFSKRTDTEKYLQTIIEKQKNIKIKAVFTLYSPFFNNNLGYRTYHDESKVYVMFENDTC